MGVLVYEIIRDSPADRAGLKKLDVITEFAGQEFRKAIDLREAIEREPVGSTQTLKVIRKGEEIELEAILAPVDDPTATPDDEAEEE
nr:PDZ domain-containing protein [Rhodopirellula baltica]